MQLTVYIDNNQFSLQQTKGKSEQVSVNACHIYNLEIMTAASSEYGTASGCTWMRCDSHTMEWSAEAC